MQLLPIFLVITACSVNYTSATTFRASGVLQCRVPGPWCYFVSLYETDHMFKDDRLDYLGVHCSIKEFSGYNLQGEEDGDGLMNNFYELTMYIHHNCSTWKNGKIRTIQKREQLEPVDKDDVTINWSLDLTNKGTIVDKYA